jgi:hypothetical protein
MPREDYNERTFTTYFDTPEEKRFWEKFAEDHGKSLSGLILEALAVLRDKESIHPKPNIIKETKNLKDDLWEARQELKLKGELIQRYESELYKIRHAGFEKVLPEGDGSRRYDLDLLQLLKAGKTLDSHGILAGLGIDANDKEAARLVWNQLESLQKYGLVHETRFGWRWGR